jgi:hypothetical protein
MKRLAATLLLSVLVGCASAPTGPPRDRCRALIFDKEVWGERTVAMLVIASTVASTYGSVLETMENHNGFLVYVSKGEERVFENANGVEVYRCD